MHLHGAFWSWFGSGTFCEYFVGKTRCSFLGVSRRSSHVAGRCGSGDDLDELYIKSKLAGGRAWTLRCLAIGQITRNPKAAGFTFDHELHALGPASDDLIEAETGRLSARDR